MSHITITQLSTILNRIKTWALSKFAVKNAVSEKLEYGDMPVVVLASMGHVLDGTASDRPMDQGDTYFLPAGGGAVDRILYRSATGAIKISDPKSNVIYCNAYTNKLYRWNAVQGEMVQVGGSISEEGGDSNKADILQIGDYSILDPGQWPKAIANTTQLQIEDSNFGPGLIVFTGEFLYLLGDMAESGDDDFEGFTYVDLGSPSADVVYFSLFDDCFYRWNSTLARFDKVSNLITAAANSGLSISAGGEISAPGKADLNTNSGRLEYGQAPIVVLVSMGSNFDDGNTVLVGQGEPYYNPTTQKITIRGGSVDPISGETTQNKPIGDPQKGLIYFNQASGKFYRWTGSTFVNISVEGVVPHIGSNGHWYIGETDTGINATGNDGQSITDADLVIGNALNGQGDVLGMGGAMRIKSNIDSLYTSLNRLYTKLANMAFWDATDQAAAVPTALDWSVPKKKVTLSLSLTNAVIKHNGVTKSNGDEIEVDEGSDLVLTVEAASGCALTAVTSSTSGATVSQDLSTVTLANVTANTTLAITATAAYAVKLNLTGCTKTSGPTNIVNGGSGTFVFAESTGYTLPSTAPTVSGATVTSWTPETGTLVIGSVSGPVTITLIAEINYDVAPKNMQEYGVTIGSTGAVMTDAPSVILYPKRQGGNAGQSAEYFIDVEDASKISVKTDAITGTFWIAAICFYNSSFNFISRSTYYPMWEGGSWDTIQDIPSGTKYIKLLINLKEEGTTEQMNTLVDNETCPKGFTNLEVTSTIFNGLASDWLKYKLLNS